jgi:hypothetical protein
VICVCDSQTQLSFRYAPLSNATVISAAIAVGLNINAILFANAAEVIAAIAELPLLLWALLLPLP